MEDTLRNRQQAKHGQDDQTVPNRLILSGGLLERRVDPLVYPSAGHLEPNGDVTHGISGAIPRLSNGVTNRPKVHV